MTFIFCLKPFLLILITRIRQLWHIVLPIPAFFVEPANQNAQLPLFLQEKTAISSMKLSVSIASAIIVNPHVLLYALERAL